MATKNATIIFILCSTELKIKLSKKQKEELRQMRNHRSGSIPLEIEDPLKEFKAKLKEQIRLNNR